MASRARQTRAAERCCAVVCRVTLDGANMRMGRVDWDIE
jgi:hypothetical protein